MFVIWWYAKYIKAKSMRETCSIALIPIWMDHCFSKFGFLVGVLSSIIHPILNHEGILFKKKSRFEFSIAIVKCLMWFLEVLLQIEKGTISEMFVKQQTFTKQSGRGSLHRGVEMGSSRANVLDNCTQQLHRDIYPYYCLSPTDIYFKQPLFWMLSESLLCGAHQRTKESLHTPGKEEGCLSQYCSLYQNVSWVLASRSWLAYNWSTITPLL